ncbi:MAG TPA: DUF6531 domain-containing protein, partial [Myxococcaceae bacterium]|nr:DUF6531 domain-containing protein [Myxococcaceae bacterium]
MVVVRYDASTASDGRQYPSVQRKVYLAPEVTTAVTPIIQFPVDTRSLQFIDGTDTAHLTFAGRHPGLSVDVEANGLSFEDGSTAGFVTMTQVPTFALPVPVSGKAPPGKLWRMEPAGIRLTGTVAFTLPNLSQLAPKRLALLLAYDPASRSMQRVGFGRASDDGSKIVPLPGVVVNSLEYVGYAPLDDTQSAAVEPVLAQLGIGGGATDGGQGRLLRIKEEPWWKRALSNAIIAQAHAQALLGLFTPAFATYDQSSLTTSGLTTIFGKVRTPRQREVQIQLIDPLEAAFPSSMPVSRKNPLHIDFTASEATNNTAGGYAGPITGRLSAVSPTGSTIAVPNGEVWTGTADGGVEVVGNVPLLFGKTTIHLEGIATFGHNETVLEASLVRAPDAGPDDGLLTVKKLSSGEDEELVAGTVRFSNTRVTVTSEADQSSVTGASGGYSVIESLWGAADVIACADVPIASKPVERPNGRVEMVGDTFSACSVNTTVYPGMSQRLDVVVDARVLYGAVRFANKDGTPVHVLCGSADAGSSWSADGGALDAISESDIKTTEVHFFKASNLETPIAKVAYVLPEPGICEGDDSDAGVDAGVYTRVRIGPADRFKAAQRESNRVACAALSDPTVRTADDEVFWRLNCAPELGFFSGLQAGDKLVVFAINHATGYAGISNITVPAITSNPDPSGACAADDAAGGPQQVTENGETYTISRCTIQDLGVPANLTLFPPEIDVRMTRQAVEEGYQSHPVKHLIRTSGGATTKDQFLQVETHWRVRRKPNNDPSTAYDGGPPILCTGKLCPDAGPIVDVGNQGPLLEQFCSEVDPLSSAAKDCLQDDSELTDVPAGVPPLKGSVVRVTGSAVEDPYVVGFDMKPRRSTAALALGTTVDGTRITNTLLRSNYYLHVIGYAIKPRDTNQDGVLEANETGDLKQPDSQSPPPAFAQGSGPIGVPAAALQIKNVYSAFETDGGVRLRYDRALEHEVRVFDIQEAIAKADGPDGGTVLSETQGAAPDDSAYQLFLRLQQPDPARTGPQLSDFAIRLGSDAFGIECKVKADSAAGTLTGDCNGADLDEVISVHDVLYLEAYLRGNAENAIYRFNFQGLAARKDYVTAGSTFTAENANKTDSELGTANRPISQPAFTTFPIKPSELSSGSIRVCVDDCNKKVLDSATLTYAGGNYTISNETGKGDEALEKLKDVGTESARFFRLLIPNEYAGLPGGGVDPPQIILELSPLTPKPVPPFTRVLGRPKGAFNGEHSEATGQATLGGVNLADGHLALDFEDFSAPEFMTQVRFVRTYNNQNDDFTEMGHGWTHNFHGEVVQENEHRYTVIIGSQSYDFPRCNSNADCPSDNSHGGTLTILGDDPDLTITFEHPDGRQFWFQRKAQNSDRKGRHRWLLEAIDDGHARQTAPNGAGWVRLEYFDQTNLLRTVHRNGGTVELDFQYEGPDRATSPDRPGPFRVRAESEDLQLLTAVTLRAGDLTRYTTSFAYDEATTNLLSAFTLGTAPDVVTVPQLWQYGYDPLQPAPKGFSRWVLANELNTAQLLLNGQVQWDARYLRELPEGDQPYPHLAVAEVVTSVVLPGYNRKPFTIGYSGGTGRSILRPDGVPVTVTLNGYGAPNLFQLPGTSTATQWENDTTEGAKVA